MAESEPLIRQSSASPPAYGSLATPSLTDLSSSDEEGFTHTIEEDHTLAFLNVSYTIPAGFKREEKTILKPLSGIMKPGLNAIMGPTGSGKTTFLDILADRKASSRVGGVVLFNSAVIQPNYRFNIGYVVQDDIVTGTLTVRENLFFSAALRLPPHVSIRQRQRRVDKVIQELRLESCADSKIGTEFIRGVSGGERKRTNIGMELIIEPQVLFLDEPTTGLDAHTAVSVMQILKGLTNFRDRIVVMSIHQPRYSIFKLFDTLTLLSRGDLVYHGPSSSSINYFKSIGFECEEHDNPADFFLDIIDAMEQNDSSRALVESLNPSEVHMKSLNLSTAYEESSVFLQMQTRLEPLMQDIDVKVQGRSSQLTDCVDHYATNPLWQCLVVCCRSGLKMWRNPMTNVIQTIVMVIFATIVGGIYFQRPDTPRGMQDRLGVLFFVVMSQIFTNMSAVELFIKERVVFLHESSGGYYRVSVFFFAKILTDLLILRLLPLSLFCAITYFMIGLDVDVRKFFIYYLTLALTTLSGAAIAFTFSALVSVFAVANLLVSLVFIIYMLFGGFLIGLDSLPSWIQWMKYISVFRYAIEALVCNELKDRVFKDVIHTFPNGSYNPDDCLFRVEYDEQTNITHCVAEGNAMLNIQGYHYSWLWYDQIALLGHTLIWFSLTYLILRAVRSYYRQYK